MKALARRRQLLLLAACLLAYGGLYGVRLWPRIGVANADFGYYFRAASAVRGGASPYVVPEHFYPPLMSFLIAPLVPLGYRDASRIWFLIGHALTLFAAWWTWRSLRPQRFAGAAVVITWLAGGAIASSLQQGQVNALLLALLVLVLWAARDALAGAALGVAVAIKLWPAILWAGDLLARRWRPLAASVAWAGVLILVPALLVATLLVGPRSPQRTGYSLGTPAFENHALPGLVLRLLDPPRAGAPLPNNWVRGNQTERLALPRSQALASAALAVGLLLTGVALIGVRAGWRASDRAATGCALLALALFALPVVWPNYQILQLPGAARLGRSSAADRRWGFLAALVASFLVVNWSEAVVLGPYLARYGTRCDNPAVTWLLSSLPPLAGLTLFALHLAAVPRRRPAAMVPPLPGGPSEVAQRP